MHKEALRKAEKDGNTMKGSRWFFALLGAAISLSPVAPARTDTVTIDSLMRKLDALDQEVRTLKRQREIEQEAIAATPKDGPQAAAGPEGFSLKTRDGSYVLRLRGLNQADSRFFLDEEKDPFINGFFIRRLRFVMEGTIAKSFDFRFMPDFAGGVVQLLDAYVDARLAPEFKARFGKFKPPVGLERFQSPQNLLFVERGLPTLLVPNRDIGIQLHGDLFAGALQYQLGVFNGVPDGRNSDIDIHDNKDYAARLFTTPFAKSDTPALEGFGIGIAASAGNEHGTLAAPALPTYLSPGQFVVFRYRNDGTDAGTVLASGSIVRISPQTYYAFGPFSFLGEFVQSTQEVSRAASRSKLSNIAYQAAGSIVLTGENASFRGVVPRNPFSLADGTWGAFEIALRFHALDVDDDAFPTFANPAGSVTRETATTVGLNWYLNKGLRVGINYDQTRFKGGASAGDRSVEKAIFTRVSIYV
jgi:phosphate-selective porin OprO/OprP